MRFYLVMLNDLGDGKEDLMFRDYIMENNFEYWRYYAYSWILATPKSVSTNDILMKMIDCYGSVFSTVIEISINDVAGIFPSANKELNPFSWFNEIRKKDYIPKWEKVKTEKK